MARLSSLATSLLNHLPFFGSDDIYSPDDEHPSTILFNPGMSADIFAEFAETGRLIPRTPGLFVLNLREETLEKALEYIPNPDSKHPLDMNSLIGYQFIRVDGPSSIISTFGGPTGEFEVDSPFRERHRGRNCALEFFVMVHNSLRRLLEDPSLQVPVELGKKELRPVTEKDMEGFKYFMGFKHVETRVNNVNGRQVHRIRVVLGDGSCFKDHTEREKLSEENILLLREITNEMQEQSRWHHLKAFERSGKDMLSKLTSKFQAK